MTLHLTSYSVRQVLENFLRNNTDTIYVGIGTDVGRKQMKEPWYDPTYKRIATNTRTDWKLTDDNLVVLQRLLQFTTGTRWRNVVGIVLAWGERDRVFMTARQWHQWNYGGQISGLTIMERGTNIYYRPGDITFTFS